MENRTLNLQFVTTESVPEEKSVDIYVDGIAVGCIDPHYGRYHAQVRLPQLQDVGRQYGRLIQGFGETKEAAILSALTMWLKESKDTTAAVIEFAKQIDLSISAENDLNG